MAEDGTWRLFEIAGGEFGGKLLVTRRAGREVPGGAGRGAFGVARWGCVVPGHPERGAYGTTRSPMRRLGYWLLELPGAEYGGRPARPDRRGPGSSGER